MSDIAAQNSQNKGPRKNPQPSQTTETMKTKPENLIEFRSQPRLTDATLLMAFTGWMDGGEVSTGTVNRIIHLLEAEPFATLDSELFYLFNFPGSMETASMFRPEIEVVDGLVQNVEMPENTFYWHAESNLIFFVGQEPHMCWPTFRDSLFYLAEQTGISRILFSGSFGGAVPHTRQPRLYITASEERLLDEMQPFRVRRTSYEGPGSFMSYFMTQVPAVGLEMISLIAEIPGYLHGKNPMSIEAVTRRLAKILQLPLELDSLRQASNNWEDHISTIVEENDELLEKIREMERDYDDDLISDDPISE